MKETIRPNIDFDMGQDSCLKPSTDGKHDIQLMQWEEVSQCLVRG